MKKRYLVTGGSGFIGTNLAREVMRRGHSLLVFDNQSRLGSAANLEWLRTQGAFDYFHGDIRSAIDVDRVVQDFKPDVVFHLAGQVAMTTSVARPDHDFAINGIGTVNLLEALRQHAPEARMTFSSSNKVYGRMKGVALEEDKTRYRAPGYEKGFNEELGLDFETPYGCSKGVADQYVLEYARTFGLNTVVFRHSTVFGGRQFATFDQGWVTWFAMKAVEQKADGGREPFTISGDGKQVRDVLFIEDLIECYFGAVEKMDQVRGEAFNIGGGMANSLSLLELFGLLEELLGVRLRYTQTPWRHCDQKIFVADVGKAKRLFGWEPRVSSREGIVRTLEWLKKQ